ncbi:hypothetical protein Pla110_29200 [Polystyrenella longa]|uniref:Uncharacterized protein n=1 Tax=Polystyrenella longa TaxID=2528007 RepID=A0A518CPN4_9PLAN|nr:hypothetical protein Pla110_29200 [Polystyrenella longa]
MQVGRYNLDGNIYPLFLGEVVAGDWVTDCERAGWERLTAQIVYKCLFCKENGRWPRKHRHGWPLENTGLGHVEIRGSHHLGRIEKFAGDSPPEFCPFKDFTIAVAPDPRIKHEIDPWTPQLRRKGGQR